MEFVVSSWLLVFFLLSLVHVEFRDYCKLLVHIVLICPICCVLGSLMYEAEKLYLRGYMEFSFAISLVEFGLTRMNLCEQSD